MEAVRGMLASAVLKVVVKEIATVIKSRITLQLKFKKGLEEMKMMLESVDALLKDAERRSIKEEAVCLWLKRLKNTMYDISKMIDEFQDDTKPAGHKWPIISSCCLSVGPKISMADRMEMMKGKLEAIRKQHETFCFMPRATSDLQPVRDQQEPASTIEEKIIQRPDEENKMMASLCGSMTQNFTILPIYGVGGVGKTTIAKKVFSHSKFRDYSKVWVYVSQTFDLVKIINSIISQLSRNASHWKDMEMIHRSLREQFTAHKEILIVLDDLWHIEIAELQALQSMLKLGEGRKVVVVTTRDEGIAREISTIEPHGVAPMTVDMCWDIMKLQSCFVTRRGSKEHEDIGKSIAVKCGGVALAAQSLGYILKDISFDEWSSVKDDDIWNVSTSEDTPSEVLASLALSYSVMPPSLKLCFAYCAIFPKGHKISKDEIIYQWASLGFIEPPDMLATWKQSGEKYIRQLLGLSFLEHSKSSLVYKKRHEDVTLFTMHDLVHDLASSVMVDEILVASKASNVRASSWSYALLNDCSKTLKASTDFPAKIKALRFMNCGETRFDSVAFSSARFLRVLDISQCSIHKFPDCIGQLKQLRYLNAPRLQDALVPESITGLTRLIYLSFRGSSRIETLPDSVGKLEDLLYLDLSKCSRIIKLPESLGELQKLKYLNLGGLSSITALPKSIGDMTSLLYIDLSGCKYIDQLPASFGELKQLVHLDLSHCRMSIPEALSGFTKLQHLNLSVAFELAAKPIRELQKVIGNLINLRYLNLSRCMHVMAPSNEEIDNLLDSICTLSNLEHLDISQNREISSLPQSIGNLRKLHTLNLLGCNKIEWLPSSMNHMGRLKVLNLKGPRSLLQESALPGLNVPSFSHFLVFRGEYSSNLFLLRRTNPENELNINDLENVVSAKEAQCIELVEKNMIERLSFGWSWLGAVERTVDDKEVLEKLVPPTSLKRWQIAGYTSASFPNWMMGIGPYLPDLSRIDLISIHNCNNLPAFGQLPNLVWLRLNGLKSMEKWNITCSNGEGGGNELLFPKLEILKIEHCPKLKIEPFPPRAVHWVIYNSDNVLSTWSECASQTGASSSSSPLTSIRLEVDFCNLPLSQWRLLHHLPALRSLRLESHIDLAASPEIIQQLSSLESLSITNFNWKDVQEELPAWLGELTSLRELNIWNCEGIQAELSAWLGQLTSLRELDIKDCEWIISLPNSIRQLSNLETLGVDGCPELLNWCRLNERTTLAHIRYKIFIGPSPAESQVEDSEETDEIWSPDSVLIFDAVSGTSEHNE